MNEIVHYETQQVFHYTNLEYLLSTLNPSEKGIRYVPHIRSMKKLERFACEKGFKPVCIWSISNENYPMTQEQLNVRKTILSSFTIPDEYNLLILNASSETSLKIKSPVDYVIIHSYENDTQVQVRGRVNNDLSRLYLPQTDYSAIEVPEDFLNRRLFVEDKKLLCSVLNIHHPSGRLYGWTSIHQLLLHAGYQVCEGREENRRYAVVSIPVNDK